MCVERHVEGVVAELGWVLQHSRAEVHGHLGVGVWGGCLRAGLDQVGVWCTLRAWETHQAGRWERGPTCQVWAAVQSWGGLRRPGAVPYGAGGTLGAAMGLGGVMGALAPLALSC